MGFRAGIVPYAGNGHTKPHIVMKNFFLVVITSVLAIVGYRYYESEYVAKAQTIEESELIQTQLKNVAKLVVTESRYSEVFSYEKTGKNLLGPWSPVKINAPKKTALVIVNSDVTVSYDLEKIDLKIDEENKAVSIGAIPDPEVRISPDFKYIEIKDNYFNTFEGEDYNAVDDTVKAALMKKVMESDMIANAENRLVSELANFFLLTRSMGWKLVYGEETINSADDLTSKVLEGDTTPVEIIEQKEDEKL